MNATSPGAAARPAAGRLSQEGLKTEMATENHEYKFDIARYMTSDRFRKIQEFTRDLPTPCLVIDLQRIVEQYRLLQRCLPNVSIYYALKANPLDEVARTVAGLGSNFDVATIYELDQLLAIGVSPDRISFGNTIKKARDIAYFYERGVRLYVTDSDSDLRKLAENAPGSRVFFRLMTDGMGADWPLSRKFGAHPDSVYRLVLLAKRMGLVPEGISFHVGSQQRDIGQWDNAISTCKYLFEACLEEGIELEAINMGGGFPANYVSPTLDIEVYATEIRRFLEEDFGDHMPRILIEPGRYLVGDSGVLVTEIVLISKKSASNMHSWVYVDVGRFGGLIETLEECIKYPIYSDRQGRGRETILAGPTCDSMDILYEDYKYILPETIAEGDRLYFLTTGAYTQSYSAINFNGLPPLRVHILPE